MMRQNLLRVLTGFMMVALFFANAALPSVFAASSQQQIPTAWDLNEKVHPDLKEGFAAFPKTISNVRDVQALREKLAVDVTKMRVDAAVAVRNEMIPGDREIPELRVRIYEPKDRQGDLPAVLWIHGGGYILGSPELDEGFYIKVAKELNCIVVSPDYRLAPEHKFPAAINDCYKALQWMADRSKELGINKERIAVAGGSAGGGLTAAVTLKARDEKGPKICFSMPLYPVLDNYDTTESSYQITDERVWNRQANEIMWELYLGDNAKGNVSPYAAPARAKDLANLPPTYIMVGALDLFRDETIDYAQRLLSAGVPVELHVYPGAFHVFERMLRKTPIAQDARSEYITALGKALNGN